LECKSSWTALTMPTDAQIDTPYTLALLSEYTHTLDALPIDLSRNFADLRELDAVLSSSVAAITEKIIDLTTMIEQGKASKQDKLWLLSDIAEEAQRLKLGGEDKIRVACQAADNLQGHSTHLRALSEHIPSFDASVLNRKTVYPHVSERSYMPVPTTETGRRRRGVLGSIMTNPDPSPKKRRVGVRDDDIDIGTGRTPKKIGAGEGSRARNNARGNKKSVHTPVFFVLVSLLTTVLTEQTALRLPQNLSSPSLHIYHNKLAIPLLAGVTLQPTAAEPMEDQPPTNVREPVPTTTEHLPHLPTKSTPLVMMPMLMAHGAVLQQAMHITSLLRPHILPCPSRTRTDM